MEEKEFGKTLQSLKTKVSQITGTSVKSAKSVPVKKNFLNKYKSFLPYGAILVCVTCLLLFIKPSFLYKEIEVEGQLPRVKLCFRKLIITIIIVSTIFSTLLFLYLKKRKSHELILTS